MFPINRLDEIKNNPQNFRLIETLPINENTLLPFSLSEPVGDERPLVILDVETTGFDNQSDKMIELGCVKCLYSPSTKRITQVVDTLSMLECPGVKLPEIIVEITGITDEDLAGHTFDDEKVVTFFENDPVVIAHNAKFDRGFFESRFPTLKRLEWGCSIKDIDWRALGFEGNKLEYLLLKLGYFYTGHRATVDCFAVLCLLANQPLAQKQLFDNVKSVSYVLRAYGAPFDCKDTLKGQGYKWDAGEGKYNKHWHFSVADSDIEQEWDWLLELYPRASIAAEKETFTARERYI